MGVRVMIWGACDIWQMHINRYLERGNDDLSSKGVDAHTAEEDFPL